MFRFSYDSVDKILVYAPHRIGRIDVNVRKGDRQVRRRRSPTPGRTSERHEKNNPPDAIPKKSNLKTVTISTSIICFALNCNIFYLFFPDDRVSCFELNIKKYRIHITNLPANVDAETLSGKFSWDIYDIVMNASNANQTSFTECWLKNADSEQAVDDFIRQWHNKKTIGGSIIQCTKEEDDLELCNKFQFGRCEKSADECHWEHIPCTAEGTCASTCSRGHPPGMKSENHWKNSKCENNYRCNTIFLVSVYSITNIYSFVIRCTRGHAF